MNKKPPRRSIVSSFSAFTGPTPAESPSGETAPERKSGFELTRLSGRPMPRVGAGVIGATQRTLSDIREERDKLLAQVEAGGSSRSIPRRSIPPRYRTGCRTMTLPPSRR